MSSCPHIAVGRILALVLNLAASFAAGYFIQPLISGNNDAINTIVTVFSILAGFLIAVITFIGDPGPRDWKDLQLNKKSVEARLWRHRTLFHFYLMTLGLALAMFVVPEEYVVITIWLERAFVGLACFVFLASFTLPQSLMALQLDRYSSAIDDQLPNALKPSDDHKNDESD
ncbi:hypothetical protein [Celeribacter halophilus]|uniref:Uncharacterized protein n=1 Tax=Celeribacter halophilus TaxID=576117 RepID=A0A1I3WW05_9RHOB|nr:hypothetical protein [Celeribacter halophilus]PZX04738.1 hypothetical protein LX82_03587 [Celeribacter halophilus]SFK11695.1 hypothetical protein SAMN04488138_1332 [Celeribacter halophilus]